MEKLGTAFKLYELKEKKKLTFQYNNKDHELKKEMRRLHKKYSIIILAKESTKSKRKKIEK